MVTVAGRVLALDTRDGAVASSVVEAGVADRRAIGGADGPGFCDQATRELAAAASIYEDLAKTRVAMTLRGMRILPLGDGVEFFGSDLDSLVNRAGAQVSRKLRKHPLWPWLSEYPGLGGVHTARLMGYLADPRRFPGARSVWHYCGLHVVNGKSPRPMKGQRCDWNPKAKTAVLMPGGIAEQIVRQRVPTYRDLYDATKSRLQAERGAGDCSEVESASGPANLRRAGSCSETDRNLGTPNSRRRADTSPEIEAQTGPATPGGTEAEWANGTDARSGLRPIQIEGIARKVAAKAFVADLWRAWRDSLPPSGVDTAPESEQHTGPAERGETR